MSLGLTFLGILLFLSSVFMMLLILVQRGKGGGLTGALGGMGGQSAFGSKAGDVFTRITVITAIIWITLCMVTIARYNPPPVSSKSDSGASILAPLDSDDPAATGADTDAGVDVESDLPPTEGEESPTDPANIDEELEKALNADFSGDPTLDKNEAKTAGESNSAEIDDDGMLNDAPTEPAASEPADENESDDSGDGN